ncbi:hypothetical protein IWW49_005354 [Coemansia sp. RSA 1797]|nr:hypothetical protein IWW49_005354 [Coemansia sp. RSA 1797]
MNPEKFWGPKARHTEAPKAKQDSTKRKQQNQSTQAIAAADDALTVAEGVEAVDLDAKKKPKTE